MIERSILTLEELQEISSTVVTALVPRERATVIALSGDLGVGKTAFVKAVAKHLGVAHEITSPTFVIMKSYEISAHSFFKTLIHIDAYRIEDEDEMRVLKFGEILSDQSNLVCIEWPEKISNLIPESAHTIEFTLNHDGTRDITYKKEE